MAEPVFPVLPSFTRGGELDVQQVAGYLTYLHENGAKTVMTTAGTSQFNLLSEREIVQLNECVERTFPGEVICGLPCLAERFLAPLIAETAHRMPRAAIMVLYPDRLYSRNEFTGFFERVVGLAPAAKFYVHGLPIRSRQGSMDYDAALIADVISRAPGLIGMKEESSTYEAGFELCSKLSALAARFEFIVAGGSMRRFLLLQAAGAQKFLSGVGSLFPQVEVAFAQAIGAGDLQRATKIIQTFETPVFETFMKIGWHPALRRAACHLGLISGFDRNPGALDYSARTEVDRAFVQLHAQVQRASVSGIL